MELILNLVLWGSVLFGLIMLVAGLLKPALALCAFIVVWVLTGISWGAFTDNRSVNHRGDHWWTDAWNPFVPHMGTMFWILLGLVVVSAIVVVLVRWIPVLGKFAKAALGVSLVLLLLVSAPAMKWWMWVILLVGIAAFKKLTFSIIRMSIILVCGALLLMFATIAADWNFSDNLRATSATSDTQNADVTPAATTTPADPNKCTSTWEIKPDQHLGGNFVSKGLQSIRDAKAGTATAMEAANDFVEQMKYDTGNLASAIQWSLNQNVSPDTLETDGCASTQAAAYVTQMHNQFNASTITSEDAPEDGTNTGVVNNVGSANSEAGVTGDRTAIKVVFPDGRTIYIMARCANAVFPSSPPESIPVQTLPAPSHEAPPPAPHTDSTTPAPQTTTPRTTTPRTTTPHTTPPAPPTTTTPRETKNPYQAPVKPTPNPSDPRVNPHEPGPGTITHAPAPSTSAAPQPTMTETPTEVQQPVPADPIVTQPTATATGNPADNCDKDGDGIPDDNC